MSDLDPTHFLPAEARRRFREGLRTPTSGWCAGWTQANLMAIPRDHAFDLLLFTQRNAKACPVIDVTELGSWSSELAPDADLRTDLPGYRIYRDGELTQETDNVIDAWTPDLVTFLFGCSFTFEPALEEAGVPVRHRQAGTNVPMYRTNQACQPAGRFRGPLVVSMRPIPAPLVTKAVEVTRRFPSMHGTPIHIGDPTGLGIEDMSEPDYGDPPLMEEGDIPVFWACGVTPQAAVIDARLPFAIGHAPGQMFVTDAPESNWADG